jgi:UDP-N-acetylglucosamine enolpyruvyl transferase
MLAADGISQLINTYQMLRGYQDLPSRLNALGANITEYKALVKQD